MESFVEGVRERDIEGEEYSLLPTEKEQHQSLFNPNFPSSAHFGGVMEVLLLFLEATRSDQYFISKWV